MIKEINSIKVDKIDLRRSNEKYKVLITGNWDVTMIREDETKRLWFVVTQW